MSLVSTAITVQVGPDAHLVAVPVCVCVCVCVSRTTERGRETLLRGGHYIEGVGRWQAGTK